MYSFKTPFEKAMVAEMVKPYNINLITGDCKVVKASGGIPYEKFHNNYFRILTAPESISKNFPKSLGLSIATFNRRIQFLSIIYLNDNILHEFYAMSLNKKKEKHDFFIFDVEIYNNPRIINMVLLRELNWLQFNVIRTGYNHGLYNNHVSELFSMCKPLSERE